MTRRYINVDIDISEFAPEQMLQGLVDAKWLSSDEMHLIAKRAEDREKQPLRFSYGPLDLDEVDFAAAEIAAGRRAEALIHIERALGSNWIGVLT